MTTANQFVSKYLMLIGRHRTYGVVSLMMLTVLVVSIVNPEFLALGNLAWGSNLAIPIDWEAVAGASPARELFPQKNKKRNIEFKSFLSILWLIETSWQEKD